MSERGTCPRRLERGRAVVSEPDPAVIVKALKTRHQAYRESGNRLRDLVEQRYDSEEEYEALSNAIRDLDHEAVELDGLARFYGVLR